MQSTYRHGWQVTGAQYVNFIMAIEKNYTNIKFWFCVTNIGFVISKHSI